MFLLRIHPPYRVSRVSGGGVENALLAAHLLALLLLCCWTTEGRLVDKPPLVTDSDLGIQTLECIVQDGAQLAAVKLWLRFLCSTQLQLHGFAAVLPLSKEAPKWKPESPHFDPMKLHHKLNITISSSTGSTAFVHMGPANIGLLRIAANLTGPGPYQLGVAGSKVVFGLPQAPCPEQQLPATTALAGRTWNVLTTTSMSSLTTDRLAYLVLQHTQHHRKLGFDGTILRSNLHESAQLLNISSVRQAVEAHQLVIWPWEQEHVAGWSTHFWQRPKHQVSLLGAYGRNITLGFIDLDEFLVLSGGTGIHDARCLGRPLLDPLAGRPMGSFVLPRYQAKSCPHDPGDLPCWEAGGQAASSLQDKRLHHALCPMSPMHGKLVLRADMVDTVSVHFSHSDTFAGNHHVNETCAHLLHFYSLVEGRRPGITTFLAKLPPVTWRTSGEGPLGVVWPQGLSLLTHEACKAPSAQKDAIKRYEQLHGSSASSGNASSAAAAQQGGPGSVAAAGAKGPSGVRYPQEQPAWP